MNKYHVIFKIQNSNLGTLANQWMSCQWHYFKISGVNTFSSPISKRILWRFHGQSAFFAFLLMTSVCQTTSILPGAMNERQWQKRNCIIFRWIESVIRNRMLNDIKYWIDWIRIESSLPKFVNKDCQQI